MPLFSWMKRSQEVKLPTQDETPSQSSLGVVPCRMLITELLWHVEERERLAREIERDHRLAHSAPGLHWIQIYPWLRSFISPSELHHLECLCAQIPPIHAPAIRSRVHQVLATNNIKPWELALILKKVMLDFLIQTQYEETELWHQPKSFQSRKGCTSDYKTKQNIITSTNSEEHVREEIPTVSGYVDRLMRLSTPYTLHRNCDLPYFYPAPRRHEEGHRTALKHNP